MTGMRGDDESNLDADREELFGSAAEPIEVADGGVGAGAAVDIAFVVEKDLGWKGFAIVSPTMAGGVGGIGRH